MVSVAHRTNAKNVLANRKTREHHGVATGRRFTFRSPLPFSSRLSRDTAERIANKWTGSGDISCEARGCAVDLIAHYARTQGIELIERDNEPAVT